MTAVQGVHKVRIEFQTLQYMIIHRGTGTAEVSADGFATLTFARVCHLLSLCDFFEFFKAAWCFYIAGICTCFLHNSVVLQDQH